MNKAIKTQADTVRLVLKHNFEVPGKREHD